MGSWGVGLYSNDVSADLKEEFKQLVRLPKDPPALLALLREGHPASADPEDEDYTDFWLGTADLFHTYGLHDDTVFARAHEIIASGADLAMKRELDMAEPDLKKRARLLGELDEKWRRPHPRPHQRRILERPEPFLFDEGACVAYPTEDGNAVNSYFSPREVKTIAPFHPDGWGAFVVFDRRHWLGVFARYVIARLHIRSVQPPTLEQCVDSVISGNKSRFLFARGAQPAVVLATMPKSHRARLGCVDVGTVRIDKTAFYAVFGDSEHLQDTRKAFSLCGLLAPNGHRLAGLRSEWAAPVKSLKLRRFLQPG